jgi:hypothetical protein
VLEQWEDALHDVWLQFLLLKLPEVDRIELHETVLNYPRYVNHY